MIKMKNKIRILRGQQNHSLQILNFVTYIASIDSWFAFYSDKNLEISNFEIYGFQLRGTGKTKPGRPASC